MNVERFTIVTILIWLSWFFASFILASTVFILFIRWVMNKK